MPAEKLHPFVYCYWELKSTKQLPAPFIYRVVADGCIDIYFDCSNPAESYVMGFCRKYVEFPLGTSFHYAGIRFLPAAFPQLFSIDATSISHKEVLLEHVAPLTAAFLLQQFRYQPFTEQLTSQLDNHLLQLLNNRTIDFDNRLYDALAIILQHSGNVHVEQDLDTGISPRQLRRLFEYYIGDSAKTFAKVVRFQHVLSAKPSAQCLRQNKLFFDAGYYDQAHFIKEFKNFYGVTPGKAFGRTI
nr:helix-turn-helix domain-containing protein [uncultured Lacibacter sp.]